MLPDARFPSKNHAALPPHNSYDPNLIISERSR